MSSVRPAIDSPPRDADANAKGRRSVRLRLRGQIQGVGFRPFVYRLAHDIGISGTVRNDPAGVTIDASAPTDRIDEFIRRLRTDAPPLARIDAIEIADVSAPNTSESDRAVDQPSFRIILSDHDAAERGRVTVDSAVCEDCLRELFDAHDRRFRHALINCTNCGPRYTIVRDLPYDRPYTTMAAFTMCKTCAAEYADPDNRRFHAQPTCCPNCGPQVALVDASGTAVVTGDAFVESARLLREGFIIAMKGLGGYHLVVDAANRKAVKRLRERKRRDHKPFAVMVRTIDDARCMCDLSASAIQRMRSPACPIVIAEYRRDACDMEECAPGQHRLGVMLPYTPMQHLLLAEHPGPLVMTSANLSDDPLVADDDEARSRLEGTADFFLMHDRPIERAVDDSIFVDDGAVGIIPIRRARGLVPTPTAIPIAAPAPGLCLGADLKNTIAIVRNDTAITSQHLGDLTYALAYERFVRTIDDLKRLFDVEPEWIALDLHPRYLSRQYGKRLAQKAVAMNRELKLVEVQHHHAHLASVMAEHARTQPTIGIICDGVGYGSDGTAWGGEILVGDLCECQRFGRLRPLRLPGGDAAARKTGRCAVSWMVDALGLDRARDHALASTVIRDDRERAVVLRMLERDLNCPPSSGLGRLFDAVASLLKLCQYNEYEAMSGQLLESAASRSAVRPICERAPRVEHGSMPEIDTRPILIELIRRIEVGESNENNAWWFHDSIAAGLAEMARRASLDTGIETVALSGGVFCNAILTARVSSRLRQFGCEVLTHREYPPNDGGIAFGQAAIAAARLSRENSRDESGL